MKFVVLVHSNPQPWGHPTFTFTAEGRASRDSERAAMLEDHNALLDELRASGELIGGRALSTPADASIFRWSDGQLAGATGPYSQSTEHLAGFFLLEVASRERAEVIARRCTAVGDTVELRTVDHAVAAGLPPESTEPTSARPDREGA